MMVFVRRKIWATSSLVLLLGFGGILVFSIDCIIGWKERENSSKNDNTIKHKLNIAFLSESSPFDTLFNLQSWITTVECIGSLYNQSCLYKNLYYHNHKFWALSLKENNLSLPGVRIAAFAPTEYYPQRRVFNTFEELYNFIYFQIDPMILSGLTVHFNAQWHENIGHALFDGLYSAYISLIRFAPRHLQPFRIFVGFENPHLDNWLGKDVYKRFSGIGLIKSHSVNSIMPKKWLVFEELLMASEMMCQRCIQPNYQLAGGIELDGSRLFRDRMYRQHGIIPPEPRRNYSVERRNSKTPLKACIIHNKRFTQQEVKDLQSVIEEMNNYTNTHMNKSIDEIKKLPYPLVHVIYINYGNVPAQNENLSIAKITPGNSRSADCELIGNKFISQLRLLRDMDIHITGPGTGQMYQTFLSDGSVNINLGGLRMNPRNKETTPIAYPSFLEQYVTAGVPYMKGLYYPINKRRNGIKKTEVMKLIQEAAHLIMKGFSIPVNPNDNLAPDGKVFVDQCANDLDFCRLVTIRRPDTYWCNNMWTEDLVHERQQWAEEGSFMDGRNWTCTFNRTLLRSLRKKYDIEYVLVENRK